MPGMPGSMSDRKRCHHDFLEAKATGKKPGKRLHNDANSFFCFLIFTPTPQHHIPKDLEVFCFICYATPRSPEKGTFWKF